MLGLQDCINYRRAEVTLSADQTIKSDWHKHWFTLTATIIKKQKWVFSMISMKVVTNEGVFLSQSKSVQRPLDRQLNHDFCQPFMEVFCCTLHNHVVLHVIHKTALRKKESTDWGASLPTHLEDRDLCFFQALEKVPSSLITTEVASQI